MPRGGRSPGDAERRPVGKSGAPQQFTPRTIHLTQRVDNLCRDSVDVLDELAGRAAASPDGAAATWARLTTYALSAVIEWHWLAGDLADLADCEVQS